MTFMNNEVVYIIKINSGILYNSNNIELSVVRLELKEGKFWRYTQYKHV